MASRLRSDNLTTMHGRGQIQFGEMGFTRDGMIVGLRARMLGDAGAYAGFGGGLVLGQTRKNGAGRATTSRSIRFDAAVRGDEHVARSALSAVRAAWRPPGCPRTASRIWPPTSSTSILDRSPSTRASFRQGRVPVPHQDRSCSTTPSATTRSRFDELLQVADYHGTAWPSRPATASGAGGPGPVRYRNLAPGQVEITGGGRDGEYGAVEGPRPDGTATDKGRHRCVAVKVTRPSAR